MAEDNNSKLKDNSSNYDDITLKEFKKTYLPEIQKTFQRRTITSIQGQYVNIQRLLREQMTQFIAFCKKFQDNIPIEIGEIQVTLLYTSVMAGIPKLCYSAYDQMGVLGNEIFSMKLAADWLCTEWELYRTAIEKKITELHCQSYFGKEIVRWFMGDQLQFLSSNLYPVTKYLWNEPEDIELFSELKLSEEFRITVGSYRDEVDRVYQKRPATDIFMRDENAPLNYCKFENTIFKKKELAELDLAHAKFQKCQFIDCTFEHVRLNDTIWTDCRIQGCTFRRVTMFGITLKNVDMEKNIYDGVMINYPYDHCEPDDMVEFYKGITVDHGTLEDNFSEQIMRELKKGAES